MKSKEYTLYRHVAPNGKMYVGVTRTSPRKRWGANGIRYKSNPYFYRAIQKYGWDNFKHEILFTNLTKDEASFAELVCVNVWDLTNPKYGYNINKGGIVGDRLSDETKQRLSDMNRGKKLSQETKDKISKATRGKNHPFYGKHHTPEAKRKISKARLGCTHDVSLETRRKLSIANKGRKRTEEERARFRGGNSPLACAVVGLDKKTLEIVFEFDSIMDAERQTGIANTNISTCCCGKRQSAGGYIWKYKNMFPIEAKEK